MELNINGYRFTPKQSTFPAGEVYLYLDPHIVPRMATDATIVARISKDRDTVESVLLMADILRRQYGESVNITLDLGYLPYARQDRVCKVGESFSLKVFCNLINQANFSKVLITDCHSEVGLALLDRVVHTTQEQAFSKVVAIHNSLTKCDYIVAPDAGASKKASAVAARYNKPLIQCLKERIGDAVTIKVCTDQDLTDKYVIVVDDICDGGATFLSLADHIKAKKLGLIVTHGIFSKGKDILLEKYDMVDCYELFKQ